MNKTEKEKASKRPFTLLELMVAIAVLLMASSALGWNMYQAIKKKQFHSEMAQFQDRFCVCQKLAMAMQIDWRGVLKKEGDHWVFLTQCPENERKNFAPLVLHGDLFFNGQVKERISFEFFTTGQILPEGTLVFRRDRERKEWKIDQLAQREKGKKLGPLHPEEER